jgi:hypothetical protein
VKHTPTDIQHTHDAVAMCGWKSEEAEMPSDKVVASSLRDELVGIGHWTSQICKRRTTRHAAFIDQEFVAYSTLQTFYDVRLEYHQ